MMPAKYKIGRREAVFVLTNSVIYKLFTGFPRFFTEISGNGQWLTTVMICAAAFLLWLIVCKLFEKFEKQDIL